MMGLRDDMLTFDGFLEFHLLCIRKTRAKSIWRILDIYGYDAQFNLRKDSYVPQL
jgi:hypothetical protein